jgi:orotate phosphoribosyltransferase
MEVAAVDLSPARAELHQLLLERAFTFGDFTLSSGRKSNFYFDGREVTLHGRGARLVGELVLERCRQVGAEAVGGLTLGADPIVAAVAALSGATDSPLQAFIVRKDDKVHGDKSRIAGPALKPGMRVVMVDDTTTTGTSFFKTMEALEGTGVEIIEAVVIVDREEGAREALAAKGVRLFSLFKRSEFPDSK